MPFELPKLKISTLNLSPTLLTLALMISATLMVGCEGSGDTQISAHSSALTYNNNAATATDADRSEVLNSTDSTALDSEAINSTNIDGSNIDRIEDRSEPADSECPIFGNVIVAKSVRVIDGDTIEIIPKEGASERIRLLGIDARLSPIKSMELIAPKPCSSASVKDKSA